MIGERWPRLGPIALWTALLVIPLAIGLAWGDYFDGDVYITFRHARNLATGRALTHHVKIPKSKSQIPVNMAEGKQELLRSPLYTLALSLLARLGVSPPQAGLFLSALGWSAAALAIHRAGTGLHRTVTSLVPTILVLFNPLVVSTLGTETPWVTALAWTAIASAMEGRWGIQTGALALMLGTRSDWTTLALALLLWIVQWAGSRRFPLWPGLILAMVAAGWGLMATQQIVTPITLPSLGPADWRHSIGQLLAESEFYWLFLPLFLCGGLGLATALPGVPQILTSARKATRAGTALGLLLIIVGQAFQPVQTARAMGITLGLFLAGLGIDWIIQWVEAHTVSRLGHSTLVMSVALITGLPLGIAQASSLLQRYQSRPVTRQELERRAGDWLRVYSEPTATILSSERVGYLADRATLTWRGDRSDPAELGNLVRVLNQDPPKYCVSFRSIAWDRLTRTDWFQDGYVPLQKFESPYDATSPLIIWGYRFQGAAKAVGANFGNQISLVSFRAPDSLPPDAEFDVRLYWEALRPPEEHYTVFIHLLDDSGQLVANHNEMRLTGLWPPGEIMPDVHHIVPDLPMPRGMYKLQMGMYHWPTMERLPIWDEFGVQQADHLITLQFIEVQ